MERISIHRPINAVTRRMVGMMSSGFASNGSMTSVQIDMTADNAFLVQVLLVGKLT